MKKKTNRKEDLSNDDHDIRQEEKTGSEDRPEETDRLEEDKDELDDDSEDNYEEECCS